MSDELMGLGNVIEDTGEAGSGHPAEKLDFNELKTWCKMFDIETKPTWKKSDYVEAIKAFVNAQNAARMVKAEEAKNAPPEGYARVIFQKDSTPGSSNRAVFLALNGRIMQAPRGIQVDIPIDFLEIVNNSTDTHTQNTNPNAANPRDEKYEDVVTVSYPYRLISLTPGAFVNPNDQRSQHYARRFYLMKKYGKWPTDGEMKAAMNRGAFDGVDTEAFLKQNS